MPLTYRVDPAYPADTLAECEQHLRLLGDLLAASGDSLDLSEKAACALMDQFRAIADAIARVEQLLREPPQARAA